MLTIVGHIGEKEIVPTDGSDLGFVIAPNKGEEWVRTFKARSARIPFQLHLTPAEIEAMVVSLMEDI